MTHCTAARRTPGLLLAASVIGLVALSGCSRDPEVRKQQYLESGNKFAEQSKYEEALIEFRNAVQIDPKFGQARLKLAETYERLGDHANALGEYVRAADLLTKDVEVQLKAGEYSLAARRPNDALARADAAIKLDPGRVVAHVLRGNALAGQKDFDQAIREMDEAIRLDPERGASYTQLGLVESVRGRTAEAEAAFKQAVKLSGNDPKSHLALGGFYWSSKRMAEAEQSFRRAWELDPKNERVNRAMAVFCLATGKKEEAEKYLLQLVETAPGLPSQFALTDYYLASGRTKDAISRLQALVTASPGVAEPQQRLAQAHAAAGDRKQAHVLVDQLLKNDPNYGPGHLLKGQLLAADGSMDAALVNIQKAVQADPKSAEAYYALGQLYTSRGDRAGAEKAFREVLRINPRATAAQIQLSRLQLASGNPTAAVQTAEEAARTGPGNRNVRLALVRSLVVARDYKRAQAEISKLLAEYPNDAAVHVQSGLLSVTQKDFPAARAKFEKALSLDPESTEAFAGLVTVDMVTRNTAGAKSRIAAYLQSKKPTGEVLVLAGRVYAASGEPDAAEKYLRQAIDVKPTLLPAYQLLGRLYLSQKKLEQARQEFDKIAERQSQPAGALTMSGIILQSQGKTADAQARYEKALASDPRAGLAANNLAWMHAEKGENLDIALQLAQTAVAAMPEAPEVLDTLGWVYYKKNQARLAIPPLRQSTEKQPENPSYHYHLGMALLQAEDAAGARQSLERALKLKSDFPGADDARQALAKLSSDR